ncbi:MAG: TonB-dependent receptor [Ferruginibacter sp.]
MKYFVSVLLYCCCVQWAVAQQRKLTDTAYLQPVEVLAIKAAEKAPFAKNNINKADISRNNLGQDLPFVINQLPAVVVNADAGNGVGYTGIRIRGTDASRINVTINGIPYNDAESQGTFFVDLPDFSSSVNTIQVQRGVGTSTNGAGAFGATINLSTNEVNRRSYLQLNNSYGSFDTWKNNLQFGSGILRNHFIVEGRLSSIRSNGYIDRATTNLLSGYGTAAYVDSKNSLRLNIFSGKEKTYQAWNGVPENLLQSDRTYNSGGTEKPGDPYDNETDNYLQTHYQLFYNRRFSNAFRANLAFFFTKGRGYYEQYKAGAELNKYGLPDYNNGSSLITQTDIVRRLWLDNDFYGSIFSLQYNKQKTQLILGGGYNGYGGLHYGEITWAQVQAAIPAHYHWYDHTAYKNDASLYAKWTQQLGRGWQSFVDLQVRGIHYKINGFRDNPALLLNNHYSFFNPKFGFTYSNGKGLQVYASYARAAHEPNRDDFEAGLTQQPRPEKLNDVEWGFEAKSKKYDAGINFYYMGYQDQLVLTGKINDVGAYSRTNIPHSYRLGIELQGTYRLLSWLKLSGNLALSDNKIKNFTEYVDDYDNGGQQTNFYSSTPISFSPAVVAGFDIGFIPVKNAGIDLIGKYVSRQYLDNTGKKTRSLSPYYVQDIRLSYQLNNRIPNTTRIFLQLNNIFSKKYEPNGYSFSYIYGGSLTTENYYFPMAEFNFMLGLNVGF